MAHKVDAIIVLPYVFLHCSFVMPIKFTFIRSSTVGPVFEVFPNPDARTPTLFKLVQFGGAKRITAIVFP